MKFLVDTGAAISVVPLQNDHTAKPTLIKLRAANGSAIDTYGERTLTLNIGMRRDFADIYRGRREGTPTRQGSTGISVATCHGREYLDLLTQFTDITLPLQTFSKPTSPFVEELRHKMARLKYATPRQQPVNSYIPQHLRDCKFVLRRTDKHLTIKRANSTDTIAIDRTKPAFLEKRQYDANPALRPLMLFSAPNRRSRRSTADIKRHPSDSCAADPIR
ncbi:unnamed protein product [Acanthosepion pharaonis]|uniref:Peptidase A2 domain-containing protein n=1 Tax=Acanthosepion pharaonis TaxID=158019 RepID=A0A812D6R6_ACAPH|nr:unnamed protein product [Sepia pharaonis]